MTCGSSCLKPGGRKQPSPVHAATHPKCGLITDIALWTKCFTTLAARYPDKAPHLMAYLQVVRASRNIEGSAWALYDAAYHRQAANNQSLDWAIPDLALYNEAFTGRARVTPGGSFAFGQPLISRLHFWPRGFQTLPKPATIPQTWGSQGSYRSYLPPV